MSPKLTKIILITLLTVGLIVLGVVLSLKQNKKVAMQVITNIENPFGLPPDDVSLGRPSVPGGQVDQSNTNNQNQNQQNQSSSNFVTREDLPVFRKLHEGPVAGATFLTIEREKVVPQEVSANLVEGYDFINYPTLRFGDDKREIADVKTVLNRQSPSPSLTIDNAFDTDLKNAVISFQTKNGLSPDGILARSTYQKLNDFQGIKPSAQKAPEKETVEFVRFVDRIDGFVYDQIIRFDEPLKMVTNTIFPRIYEAYFDNTKTNILMRHLKISNEIENVVASIKAPTINPESSVNYATLENKILPEGITFVSLLPNKTKAFFLAKEGSKTDLISHDFKSGRNTKVWSSSFSEWIPQVVSENIVSLTPRASANFTSNSYILDIKNKSLKNVISGVNGLTTSISPDGKKIIYSSFENSSLKTSILDVTTRRISDFAPTTLPEKCVWTKDSKTVYCAAPMSVPPSIYPDNWYKGVTLFADILWKVNVNDNVGKIILDQSRISEQSDMTNLVLNDKEDYLIFINKHNLHLYGIDLARLE
jgi:hypothetical protein